MKLALQQAKLNLGNTKENPSVGCAITKKNNLISLGHTSIHGRPHAETNAIKFSAENLKNCTIYTTLEPCSHYGKTSPCTSLIIKKKFKKVFYSINDPDIRSFNRSINIFKKKNIIVRKGFLYNEVKDFYKSYLKSKKSDLPYVTCKIAASKDYFTVNKNNNWITNEYSRGRVHLLRSSYDCIITSVNTIIKDNPKLDCRISGLERFSPTKIILDKNLKIPLNSNIIKQASKFTTIILHNKINKKKIENLKKNKIKLKIIPIAENGYINLRATLLMIKNLGYSRIFFECGANLTNAILKEKLVDEFALFVSNKKLINRGKASIKNYFNSYLKGKTPIKENVNLFGEKLLIYKLK